ncbi:permease prefix domain 1-containing protein [Catenuloplanes indicus]|uniref:Uncharacterized protein n=1 Tax=Catenuloplanes indicus TaxID=137267 RepID=A0AAE4AYX1_9ACTN|nr:permease prefix domain 1-containing protein [Catenuloplanes indicus]MDQ0368445.1 hypothetical protein [Catenuloplanes indicus]
MRIDEFLRRLDAGLSGPRRRRADLLREARDGLADSAAALRARGVPAAEAERLAVAEFGADALDELIRDYRIEIAAGQGRRVALLLLLIPAGLVTSDLLWWRAPTDTSGAGDGFLALADAVAWLGYAGGALALAALAGLRGHARRRTDPRRLIRALGLLALAVTGAIWVFGSCAAADTLAADPAALTWPPMVAALLLLHGTQALMTWLALRTLRDAHR